jgi:NAD dependent epimerase/dehydratase family
MWTMVTDASLGGICTQLCRFQLQWRKSRLQPRSHPNHPVTKHWRLRHVERIDSGNNHSTYHRTLNLQDHQITGVSGFIGFKILVLTLEAGYRVRGVVRKQDQISDIKNALPNQELSEFAEFAVLTDLTAPQSFDSVIDGVSYVIHVASPMVRLVSLSSNFSQRVSSAMLTPKIRVITMSETCLSQP